MKHMFFYDESEHSRKLTKETVNADNFASHFVVGIIGFSQKDEFSIEHGYKILESMRASNELKSKTFKFSQFQNGFVSFNKANKKLLSAYLDFLISFNLFNYISIVNKLEYVVLQLFKDYKNSVFGDMDVLRYVVSKLLNVYKPKLVIDALYRNDGTFIGELKDFAIQQVKKNQGLVHKDAENRAFNELTILLSDYNEKYTVDWNYMTPFIGFQKYKDEMNITDYVLYIDKEGEGSTINSARCIGLVNVFEVESSESTGVRIADMFTGIISKLIKAIDNDLDYKTPEDSVKYTILSIGWFNLDEETFFLYKKLGKVIFEQHQAHFKSFAGNYSDTFIYFIAFLGYIHEMKTYGEYVNIEIIEHQKRVNNLALGNLQRHSDRMTMKIPIKKLEEDDKDYYLNQKGAKTYRDYKKHDMLKIPPSSKKGAGIVYDVLNVGSFGVMEQPCITILENGNPVLYLLPMELLDWTILCVGLAMRGTDLFPNKVMFHNLKGRYYADVL